MRRLVAASTALVLALPVAGAPPAGAGSEPGVEFRFRDPAIVESSGLVARRGLFATVNDSGDSGRVFTVDPRTGRTVGVTTWPRTPVDVEALAPAGRKRVWVGDIGDNGAARSSVRVMRVPIGRGSRRVTPRTYRLVYPGGPQDAETLMTHPRSGRLVVVTKGLFGGDVLLAPKRLDPRRPNRMRRVGGAIGIATDGAFLPGGRHIVVRSYGSAAVYTWPGLRQVSRFDLPGQPQGEGLAVRGRESVFLSSEGARQPVLRVRLPAKVRRALRPVTEVEAHSVPRSAGDESAPDEGVLWPWIVAGVAGVGALGAVAVVRRPRG